MSVLNQIQVNSNFVKTRWKEKYVSEGLNRKFFGIFPKGVYGGFTIGPGGLHDRDVIVSGGSVSGGLGSGLIGGYVSGAFDETVGWSIAVHQSVDGYSTTVSIPPSITSLHLDATGLDGQRVYVALSVTYAIENTTLAHLRIVDAAELDLNPSLVVLGYIDVPVSIPLDISMFGYDDPNYPRLSPLSNPLKSGLMPASAWDLLNNVNPWSELIKGDRDPNSNYVIQLTPSQKVYSGKRIYSFIQSNQASRFPRNASEVYNGGANNDQLTKLNITTGLITGAHSVTGNTTFSVASVSGTPNSFQLGVIHISPTDRINVTYGSVYGTSGDAVLDSNFPSVTSQNLQALAFLVETDGSGVIKPLSSGSLFDRRPFINLGGGGGVDLENINVDIAPDSAGARNVGTLAKPFGDLFVSQNSINFVNTPSDYSTLRRNSTTQALEYRKNPTAPFIPLGAGGGADLLQQLNDAETGRLVSVPNNNFIDTFKTEISALTGLSIADSVLTLDSLSGTLERSKETSTTYRSSNGIIILAEQCYKPKNTAAFPTATSGSVQFEFSGNLTGAFVPSGKFIFFKEFEQDLEVDHKFLTDEGLIERISVTSSTYVSGSDLTQVIFSNPKNLDLDFDLSASQYSDNLRVRPYDHSVLAKAGLLDAFEEMDLTDETSILDPRIVAIQGDTGLVDLTGLTNSARVMATSYSENRQYAVKVVMEHNATTQLWHFYYSKDPENPNSWTKYATTKSVNSGAVTENNSGQLQWFNSKYIFISNNGQAFICYNYYNGAGWQVNGFYSDLTIVTPTLTDTANLGGGAGVIGAAGSQNVFVYEVSGDITDGSLITVWAVNGVTGAVAAYTFSSGGAVHDASATSIFTGVADTPARAFIVGTSPSRRHILVCRNSANDLRYIRYNEGNLTGATPAADNQFSVSNPGTSIAVTCQYGNNSILVHTANDSAADHRIFKITNTESGTEVLSSAKTFLPASGPSITTDGFVGESDSSGADNFNRVTNKRIVANPSDPNHVFLSFDVANLPDQTACSWLWEIEDIDSYVGIEISQYNRTDSVALRDTTTRTEIGQTLTLASTVFKTGILPIYQVGNIPTGYNLWVELWSNSAGVPNTLVDTSQMIDPSKITRSTTGKWVPFYFNTGHNLTGDYTLILKGDFPISASNFIRWIGQSAGSYGGGKIITYNGSTWDTTTLAAWDFAFIVNGEWVQEVGESLDSTISPHKNGWNDQESTIVLRDSSTIQLTYRRAMKHLSTVTPFVGHYFRKVISIGSGGTKSTLTNAENIGYGSRFEPYMVFSTALGDAEHQRRSITTGALDTAKAAEDRSGYSQNNTAYANMDATNITADSDFFWGTSLTFNGIDESITYVDLPSKDFDYRVPFCCEFEIKPATITGDHAVLSDHNLAAPGGFRFMSVGSAFQFYINNTSDVTIARIRSTTGLLSIGQYYKIKITYDGLGGQMRGYYSTDKNTPATTEFTYDGGLTINFSSGNSASTNGLRIGASLSGVTFWDGQIGYIKWISGSDTFAYEGYYPQPAMNSGNNLGVGFSAWKRVGNSDHALSVSFLEPFVTGPNTNELALADSYYQIMRYQKYFSNEGQDMALRIIPKRQSLTNEVKISGINFQYNKF